MKTALIRRPVPAMPSITRPARTGREHRRLTRALGRVAGAAPLVDPGRAAIWLQTSGRRGSLSVSPLRVWSAACALARLGLLEGRSRDPYAVDAESTTAKLARDHLRRETAGVLRRVNRVQADLRSAALSGVQLTLADRWTNAALIAVILGVDTLLNTALVERLAGIGQLLALLASFAVSILLLLVSHLVVAGTPPGQRLQVRRTLIVVLLLGFAVFVVAGGYLRTHSAGADHRGSLGLSGVTASSSWMDLAGPAAGYATMLGLLVTTFAAASLAGLHQQQRLDQLRADDHGAWAATLEARSEQVVRDGIAVVSQLEAAVDQLVTVHAAAYHRGLPADVADRLNTEKEGYSS